MSGRSNAKTCDVYGGQDPRDVATYHIREASRYIRVPYASLYRWCFGYKPATARVKIAPLIQVSEPPYLSFWNMAEVYILSGIINNHGVALQSARRAIEYVKKNLHVPRPLLTQQFETDGIDLFIDAIRHEQPDLHLINASRGGQLTIRDLITHALTRVSRDFNGVIKAIYPHTSDSAEGRVIEIDPRRSFGRPVIIGTRIPAETVASRWRAGDSIEALASDFEVSGELIERALRWADAKAA